MSKEFDVELDDVQHERQNVLELFEGLFNLSGQYFSDCHDEITELESLMRQAAERLPEGEYVSDTDLNKALFEPGSLIVEILCRQREHWQAIEIICDTYGDIMKTEWL